MIQDSTPQYLKKKNANLKRYMHPCVYCSIIYNSQVREATQVVINRWMDKERVVCMCVCDGILLSHKKRMKTCHLLWGVCVCDGILLSHKKEWKLAICHSMEGPWGYFAKWNKADREKQILYDFSYMWNLKNKWTNITKLKQSYRHREQASGCQSRGGGQRRDRVEGD